MRDVPDLPDRLTLAALRPGEVVDFGSLPATLRRVIGLTRPYRRLVTLATLATLGTSATSLALPPLLGRAVDVARAAAGHGTPVVPVLWPVALGLVVLGLARGLLTTAMWYLGEKVGQHVGYDLRMAFFARLQVLGFDFHDRVHTGELITRGMLDLEGVRGFVEQGWQRIVLLGLLVAIAMVQMLRLDPSLALVALSFVPVAGLVAMRTGLAMRIVWTRLQERMAQMTRIMEENLQGVRVVRAFAAERHEYARYARASAQTLRLANFRIVQRASGLSAMQTAFLTLLMLVLWIGGERVAAGRMSVGTLTQFLATMTVLQMPVRQIIIIVNAAARAASSAQRLFAVIDRVPAVADRADARDLPAPRGELRFERVSFRYPGAARDALCDVSFAVGPGRVLGVVGAPGAGKSTLAHLIPRFYEAQSGRITLDGIAIADLRLEALRRAVAVVAQDVFLFDSAASDNIAYAVPDAQAARIADAAETARIHDHIAAMAQGYATRVGERGVSLSGGQRQRMTIARGLAPAPAVLVLDDSLSALDTATEAHLRQGLRRRRSDQATIVIAHRLSALADADEILVLDHGAVAERGTHAELVAADGIYARLWALQQHGNREEVAA
jgi:ATP-binding cassette, subfamily B, multidrug efflux pump